MLSDEPPPPMLMAFIVLPLPVSLNAMYMRQKAKKGGDRFLTSKGKEYKAKIVTAYRKAGLRMFDGPIKLEVRIYRSKKAGDLDNYFKVLMDSLTGLAWNDDGQVSEIHAYRDEDKKEPRAEVTINAIREEE